MDTYDPYDTVERPTIGIFDGLASAAPGTVLVVHRDGKPLRALVSPEDRLTAGEARFGRIRTLYRVIVGEREIDLSDSYPCADAGAFLASGQLTCRVVDPVAIVHREIHDVAKVILPRVAETIRSVCRTFAAEAAAEAESAALAAVREIEGGQGHDPAFRITRISLALARDADAEAFVKELKGHERTGVLARSQTDLDRARAEMEASLAKQQQQLLADQAALQAKLEQARLEMQREREKQEAELALARMQQEESLESERQRLRLEREALAEQSRMAREQTRTDHYLGMLAKGQYGLLALQLAQDPGTVERVALQLAQRQTEDARQQLEALKVFIEANALEAMDIGDRGKEVLARLVDGWSRGMPQLAVTAGVDDAVTVGED